MFFWEKGGEGGTPAVKDSYLKCRLLAEGRRSDPLRGKKEHDSVIGASRGRREGKKKQVAEGQF